MLRQLDSTIWVNEVPFKLFGLNFGNRMTCIKMEDDSIWLHSMTKFDDLTYEKIETIGKIKYLVVPSLMHNLFVMDWKEKNPATKILAPAKIKKVNSDIVLDEVSVPELNQLFNEEILCIPLRGIPVLKEFAFIHHSSKTLILTDLAFNFGDDVTGWDKYFLKLYGAYNKFGPTITIRALIKDKAALRESLKKIASYEFDRIIMSHGKIVESGGKEIFNKAFKKYLES